jgi:hypothetical protein
MIEVRPSPTADTRTYRAFNNTVDLLKRQAIVREAKP